jgi:transcriptional regulator with XRE-family HTH domain
MKNFNIGAKIAEIRKQQGFTQEQLSILTKLTKMTIYNVENNLFNPKVSTIIAICNVLNTTPDEVLGFNQTPWDSPPQVEDKGKIDLSY